MEASSPFFNQISPKSRALPRDDGIRDLTASSVAPSALDLETEAEIEDLIRTPLRFLSISKRMRQFYQTYRWQGRNTSTRHWLLAIAVLNILCVVMDVYIVSRQDIAPVLAGRLLISAAFVAATVPLLAQRSALVEGLCVITPCVTLLLTTGLVGFSESPLLLERYSVNACFVIATGIVFLRIESFYITILTAITCVLMPFFILASHIEPVMAKVEIVFFHVGAMITLWNANRIQMLYRYRGIILSLNNEIQARKMGAMNTTLLTIAFNDPLTGIANRRRFDETCAAIDPMRPIAALMIDIDRFKMLNDTLGHAEGDRCLRLVAQTIRDEIRSSDLVARYGGEEFAVLIENAEPGYTRDLAERIRIAVSKISGEEAGKPRLRVTISIGAAQGLAADHDTILKQADAALYKANESGRNRVVFAQEMATA